jgi:spermidine synthase
MKRWEQLGIAQIPNDGGELKLSRRDQEFAIRLSGIRGELMNSRVHHSEEVLAELGCAGLQDVADARVLIGGLGMGFTLTSALDATSDSARVTVAELIPEVVDWNRGQLGDCAGRPLDDPRTVVHVGDVGDVMQAEENTFHAILLDVDNGPEGLTQEDNNWLYSTRGLQAAYRALRPEGMLAIWSAGPDSMFTIALKRIGFQVEVRTVRARPGKGSRHTLFFARRPFRDKGR